jgi:hypothetical protein
VIKPVSAVRATPSHPQREVFVGDDQDARLYQNSTTQVIEMPHGMVLPGFIDSHVHLLWGGLEMNDCQLHNLKTSDQIFQALRDYFTAHPKNEWLRGSGWELPIFPGGNPRKEWLDEISPDKPIFLVSVDRSYQNNGPYLYRSRYSFEFYVLLYSQHHKQSFDFFSIFWYFYYNILMLHA